MWRKHLAVSSAIHPDTDTLIPKPFRMSGYVPFNGPVALAMVASGSTSGLLFWSWVNQSQNALVNYFNRNASSPMSDATLAKSYGGAVTAALTVAFGLSTFIKRRYPPAAAAGLLRYVAFPSAVLASSLNCYVVRSPEIAQGVPLLSPNGTPVPCSPSTEAARWGVVETTASRAVLQFPVYFLPPLLVQTLPPLRSLLRRSPHLTVPITTYLLLVSFGFGLPSAIALFPQIRSIEVDDLEEGLRLELRSEDFPYTRLYYNRGL